MPSAEGYIMVKEIADMQLLEELVQIGSRVQVKQGIEQTTRLEFGFPHHVPSEGKMHRIGDVVMHVVLTYFGAKRRTQAHIGYTIVDDHAVANGTYVEVMTGEHYMPRKIYEKAAHALGMFGVARETLREAAESVEASRLQRYFANDYQRAIDKLVGAMGNMRSIDASDGVLASRYFATPQHPHAEGVIVVQKSVAGAELYLLGANLHGSSVYDERKKDEKSRVVVKEASGRVHGREQHIRPQLAAGFEGRYIDPAVLEEAADSLAPVKGFTYTPAGLFGFYAPDDK